MSKKYISLPLIGLAARGGFGLVVSKGCVTLSAITVTTAMKKENMMMVMTTRGDVKKRCEHNGQIGEISQRPLPPTVLLGTHLDDLLLSYSDHVGQS